MPDPPVREHQSDSFGMQDAIPFGYHAIDADGDELARAIKNRCRERASRTLDDVLAGQLQDGLHAFGIGPPEPVRLEPARDPVGQANRE
jgi:hypothetical protein